MARANSLKTNWIIKKGISQNSIHNKERLRIRHWLDRANVKVKVSKTVEPWTSSTFQVPIQKGHTVKWAYKRWQEMFLLKYFLFSYFFFYPRKPQYSGRCILYKWPKCNNVSMPHILISICFPVRKLNSLAADILSQIILQMASVCSTFIWAFHLSKLDWPLQAPLMGHQCFSNTGSVFTFRQLTMKFIWLQWNLAFLRGSRVNCYRKKNLWEEKSVMVNDMIYCNYRKLPWLFKLWSVGLSQIKCQAATSTGR